MKNKYRKQNKTQKRKKLHKQTRKQRQKKQRQKKQKLPKTKLSKTKLSKTINFAKKKYIKKQRTSKHKSNLHINKVMKGGSNTSFFDFDIMGSLSDGYNDIFGGLHDHPQDGGSDTVHSVTMQPDLAKDNIDSSILQPIPDYGFAK